MGRWQADGRDVDRVAIVVAGMHRSGTSALTRVLGSLGCGLPKTLMPANEYNVPGYWESEEVASLNDTLLESAGSSWDDWEPFNPDWYASPVAGEFRGRALSVLAAEFEDAPMFVLKDPRIARLLPFWTAVLGEYGADVRVALPIRNPVEVAGSLQARDAIDPSVGLLLWLRHVLDAEAASRDHRRSFVRFEDLLRDWEAVAAMVARDLELSWPRQSTSVSVEIGDRLEPSARHQVADDSVVLDRPELSGWVTSTFEVLDRWAQGDERASDGGDLDAIRAAFDEAGSTFARPIVAGMRAGQRSRGLEQEIRALKAVVEDREGQIDSLNRAVRDRDENVTYLDGVVQAKDRELDRLGITVSDRDREIDALQHVVAGRDGEITTLNDALSDRDGRIDALGRQAADRDREIAAFVDALRDRDHQIATLDRAAEQVAHDRALEVETLKGAVEERDALRQTAQERQVQIDALHEVIDQRDHELAAVYGSSSWRLTTPLRVAKALLLRAGRMVSRGLASGARGTLRIGWRLLPLPGPARARLKRTGIGSFAFLGPLARSSAHRPASPVKYISSGWLDLADLHYEARRNGTGLPILFDPDWYLETYPDIRKAAVDPLVHYLRDGAVEGRWPVELEAGEVDPVIEGLHRLDVAAEEAHALDAGFLRVLYPDLAGLSDSELTLVCTGNGERVASKAAFVFELCQNPREIPLDFDASQYIRLYPDLRFLADRSPLEALRHYMCHGRFEPRLHTLRTDPPEEHSEEATAETRVAAAESGRPLCVLAHVYYPELWDELAGYLGNLPPDCFDLYVNLVDDTFESELLGRIRVAFPEARVYVSENVGRDIGGHFQLLRNLHVEDYSIFCLVHTKKSPHMAEGEVQRWRRRLLEPLLGTRECAAENVRIMLEDDAIGVVGSAGCRYTEINANRDKYDALLDRLSISERSDDLEFLSGTMMFLRSDLLGRIFDVAQGVAFERSAARTADGDPDGAWAHAVERVFGAVARDMGYRFEWR